MYNCTYSTIYCVHTLNISRVECYEKLQKFENYSICYGLIGCNQKISSFPAFKTCEVFFYVKYCNFFIFTMQKVQFFAMGSIETHAFPAEQIGKQSECKQNFFSFVDLGLFNFCVYRISIGSVVSGTLATSI